MWNYLKSDFEELLNVVKEDSNVILEKLHDESKVAPKKATAASQEAARRVFLEETYLVPLLLSEDDDDADELMDDAERERVEQFLLEFKIDDQTDDISQLLSRPDGIVREYFEALVPHEIPYEDFWRRYYYRCDELRIQTAWDAQEAAAQQARAELVGSVSSFLGGAAKSLALTVKEVVAQKDGRPPFVMNTAVDEDSDDEEEEEEELGWDDEDEEEEEGAAVVAINNETAIADPLLDDSADTEQIEFHIDDETLNKTKEELKQAVLERDQLQQTVELLKKELVTANSNVTAAASDKMPSESSVDVTVLQEKEAEIESLKASLAQMTASAASSTSSSHDDAVAKAKVQELTEALAAKDRTHETTTSALQDEIISLRAKLATSEAAALDDAEKVWKVQMDQSSATIASLTTQLTDLQTKWELAEDRIHQDSGDKTSEDSGVPVEAVPPVVAARMPKRGGNKTSDDEDGETSDGWGDEW
jgi:BSD domain